VAEEDNFLFSYNLKITKAMRKALNRERTNVGRTAYTDRVKATLLACREKAVASLLVEDLKEYESGKLHDELKWADVSVHACKLLNSLERVVFLTPSELVDAKEMADRAKKDGFKIVTIPDSIKEKIRGLRDLEGKPIRDLEEYTDEWNDSFKFTFVRPSQLTERELAVFDKTKAIFDLIGGRPRTIKDVLISETMRMQAGSYHEAVGLWDAPNIVIKRTQLKSLKDYAGTLLHETAHAVSGESDVSEEFEDKLTELLGQIAGKSIEE
jgi:hypothetical protein